LNGQGNSAKEGEF